MTVEFLIAGYLVLVALQFATALLLEVLNLAEVRRHAAAVPELFHSTIDLASYQRGTAYTRDKTKLSIVSTAISSLTLVVIVMGGLLGHFDTFIERFGFGPYLHGLFFIFGLSVIFSVIDAPLQLYSIFVLEERYGFNTTTFPQWVRDTVKSAVLSAALGAPVLLGLFWFIDSAGSWWWVYAFLFVASFQFLLMYLYPILIAPLFNRFEPLAEGSLKQRIAEVAKRADFSTAGIFVMDGSRRSAHANAYFTGFGKNKRIVLFDTLLQTLTEDQTIAVLAHEIGHEKRHHIKKMMVFSLAMLLLGLWVLSLALDFAPLYQMFGIERPSPAAAIVVLSFASGPLTFFLSPFISLLSRRYEYEADRFAAALIGTPTHLAQALCALSKRSLANLTPHSWYSFFHYSHPTLFERLSALERGIVEERR